MKVYLIFECNELRICCSTKLLAEKICDGFGYLGLKIVEIECIGEYQASN